MLTTFTESSDKQKKATPEGVVFLYAVCQQTKQFQWLLNVTEYFRLRLRFMSAMASASVSYTEKVFFTGKTSLSFANGQKNAVTFFGYKIDRGNFHSAVCNVEFCAGNQCKHINQVRSVHTGQALTKVI